jgi:CRP/FNR family transcriptional regulator
MLAAITDRVTSLKRTALFSDLSERELGFLAQRALVRQYCPNQLIFTENDPCEGLHVVASGTIRIFKTSADGREQALGLEHAGSSIAELPVFDGGNYPASAVAVTESILLIIRKDDFRALFLQHPEVGLKVLKVVSRRLRYLVGLVEELSFTTVRQRLAAILLRMAKRSGKRTGRGIEFTIIASNQEIAAQIGTVRELVSRNLGRLHNQGIIKLEGKNVVIPDLSALEGEAKPGD